MWSMKRGRGRPRKGSLYSNFSNTQNSYLEEGKPYVTPLLCVINPRLLLFSSGFLLEFFHFY